MSEIEFNSFIVINPFSQIQINLLAFLLAIELVQGILKQLRLLLCLLGLGIMCNLQH